jgi:hypothetical protein
MNKLNSIFYSIFWVILLAIFIKYITVGPCNIVKYIFNNKYRAEFDKWMINKPR